MEPKRIILRLRNEDFPLFSNSDIRECIKSFLTFSNRSPEELDAGIHYFHVQPPMTPNGRFHIVIDLETSKHSGILQSDFPHEIYRVLPKDDIIHMIPISRKEERENLIQKIRKESDQVYPWGQDKNPSMQG